MERTNKSMRWGLCVHKKQGPSCLRGRVARSPLGSPVWAAGVHPAVHQSLVALDHEGYQLFAQPPENHVFPHFPAGREPDYPTASDPTTDPPPRSPPRLLSIRYTEVTGLGRERETGCCVSGPCSSPSELGVCTPTRMAPPAILGAGSVQSAASPSAGTSHRTCSSGDVGPKAAPGVRAARRKGRKQKGCESRPDTDDP